jgi:hypothetical protein
MWIWSWIQIPLGAQNVSWLLVATSLHPLRFPKMIMLRKFYFLREVGNRHNYSNYCHKCLNFNISFSKLSSFPSFSLSFTVRIRCFVLFRCELSTTFHT